MTPQQKKTPFAALPVRLILKSKMPDSSFRIKTSMTFAVAYRETVTLMGFTPTHLSLAIGMLNGVFKER